LMDHSAQAIEVRRLILFPSILHTWNDRNMAAGRLKTCHLAWFYWKAMIAYLPTNCSFYPSTHCKCRWVTFYSVGSSLLFWDF
jgi:hypothetical protein